MARLAGAASGPSRRWRGWSAGVWILAALLGMMAVGSAAGLIHEGSQRRAAAHLFVRALASQVDAVARERLLSLAYQKMGTANARSNSTGTRPLDALVGAELEARTCRCRDSVPAREFFKYDAERDSLQVAIVGADRAGAIDRAALSRVAREDAGRTGRSPWPSVHLAAGRALGDRAVVTFIQRDARTTHTDVYGFTVDARALAAMLVAPAVGDTGFAPVKLDSTSVGMETADSVVLFGRDRAGDRPIAAGRGAGPLDAIRISVALDAGQLPRAFLGPPRQELWHLGALILATLIVVVIAARWSRREVLLARARSDFIAGVSHDLRMPLAQILLASETLVARPVRDDAERHGLANSILREARRLIGMVENILLFSQSGAVEERPRSDTVPVSQLFEDVVDAVHLAVDDAGQRIEVAGDPGLAVLGGRRSLCQALVNLVDNSLKYGRPHQCILLGATRRPGGEIWLTVQDEGPGVPAAERGRIFDAYHRLSRDERSERTGTGLGLAVVQRIAEQCNGRVWLDEAPGGGARAVIELHQAAATPALELMGTT